MTKKFESFQCVSFFFFLFLSCFVFSIVYLSQHFYTIYQVVPATVVDYERLEFLMDDDSFHKFCKNKFLYIEGKKYTVSIENVMRDILKKKKVSYHQVEVNVALPRKYQLLDVITVFIYDKKKNLLTIFESCWKGGSNEEDK